MINRAVVFEKLAAFDHRPRCNPVGRARSLISRTAHQPGGQTAKATYHRPVGDGKRRINLGTLFNRLMPGYRPHAEDVEFHIRSGAEKVPKQTLGGSTCRFREMQPNKIRADDHVCLSLFLASLSARRRLAKS